MSSLGDDCYFFCTSSCAKGPACPFRHVESAKTAKIICQHWQMGNCLRPMCKFRHSDFKLQIDASEIPCFWESQPSGCLKQNCLYKHNKPRPQTSVTAAETTGITDGNVPPTVTGSDNSEPISTAPASLEAVEKSCQSPVKQPERLDSALGEVKNTVEDTTSLGNLNDGAEIKGAKMKEAPAPVQKKPKKSKKSKKTSAMSEPAEDKTTKQTARPSVKARLGAPPKVEPVQQNSSGSESDSDSDDSIENIKVMSMEEIFRQKALESMMKKRAEGKTLPAIDSSCTSLEKKEPSIKAKSSSSSEESESSSSSSSSSSDEAKKEGSEQSDSSSSSSSSDSSESSDSDQDIVDDFEFDVRRVVVEDQNENVTKKKALEDNAKQNINLKKKKVNLLKVASSLESAKAQRTVETSKKRKVDVDYDSDDLVSCRVKQPLVLNVHDRLGKSLPAVVNRLKSKNQKTGLVSLTKRIVSADVMEPDQKSVIKTKDPKKELDPLAEVKVKTLEEIKQEKMRKLAAKQQKESLQTSPGKPGTAVPLSIPRDKEVVKKRLVLLSEEPQSDDTSDFKSSKNIKRLKKFAQKRKTPDHASLTDKEEVDSVSADVPEAVNSDDQIIQKHKHKHRQKNSKKSKTERQIYVPPALKNNITERNQEVKLIEENSTAVPAASKKRERHPMAAVWAAGLTLSAKGSQKSDGNKVGSILPVVEKRDIKERIGVSNMLDANRVSSTQPVIEKRDVRERIGLGRGLATTKIDTPSKDRKISSKNSEETEPAQVTIKSFSEIMSEKRQRRLEMQTKKNGVEGTYQNLTTMGSSLKTKLSVSQPSIETKPRVPIKPIVFDLDSDSGNSLKLGEESLGDAGITKATSQISHHSGKKTLLPSSKENESTSSLSDYGEHSHRGKLKSPNRLNKKNAKLFKKKKSSEHDISNLEVSDSYSAPVTSSSPVLSDSQDNAREYEDYSRSSHFHSNTPSARILPSSTPDTETLSSSVVKTSKNLGHGQEANDAISTDSEQVKKKSRLSIEDEFNFFEDEGYDYTGTVTEDVEPIDDLLQDIDDLLS